MMIPRHHTATRITVDLAAIAVLLGLLVLAALVLA